MSPYTDMPLTASAAFDNTSDIPVTLHSRWTEKNLDGDTVEKRIIRTPDGSYDPTTVPPEWFRWLQKTRAEPPTIEEIEK